MKGFSGFTNGMGKTVPIPAQFFSELLPYIDHPVEFKVTLYAFWALQAQEGKHRYINFAEACRDEILLQGLHRDPAEATRLLKDGFERAVARGTLLHVTLQEETQSHHIYFLNSEKGREACDALQRGEWLPGDDLRPIALIQERPTIYRIFEQNIGAITPLVADELRDLERTYSSAWLEDAIKIAVANRVASLKYIIKILQRWQQEGREGMVGNDHNSPSDDDYLAKYADWMK